MTAVFYNSDSIDIQESPSLCPSLLTFSSIDQVNKICSFHT